MAIRPTLINRDYFQQMYRSNKSYADQMRLATETAKDAVSSIKQPESELVRPYLGDAYTEMEYNMIPPSGEVIPSAVSAWDLPWIQPPSQSPSFNQYWGEGVEPTFKGAILYPTKSSDDSFVIDIGSSFQPSTIKYLGFGKNTTTTAIYSTFIRFPNVKVDRGVPASAFSSVFLRLTQSTTYFDYKGYEESPFVANIFFNNSDNAVAPTTYAEYTALSKTTAKTEWTISETWAINTSHDSPDLSSMVAEVVSRPGWASGNALMVMIEYVSGTGYRTPWSFDNGTLMPELHII